MTYASQLTLPMFILMILTGVVWLTMFVRRVIFLQREKIDMEDLRQPEERDRLLPPAVAAPGHNFKNLLEMPILFYALCLYLMIQVEISEFYVSAAWAYVTLRILQSIVHCTYNRVLHRFLTYFLSSLILWAMIGLAVWEFCAK